MEQKHINRVEAYFNGELNEKESKQFESLLQEDPELAQMYQEYVLAKDVIDRQVEHELRDKFKKFEKERNHQAASRFFPILWKVAAAIVLLVSVYLIFFDKDDKVIPDQALALNSYTLPSPPSSTMGDMNEIWAEGLEKYKNEDFSQAAEIWSTISNPDPEMKYYLAHAYFNAQEFNKSSSLFDELSNGNSVYNFPSDWYLALSFLADQQKESFEKQISKISEAPTHPYYEDAIELKDKSIL